MDNKISNRLFSINENVNNKCIISYIQHTIDYMKFQRNILRSDNNILNTVLYRQLCKTLKFILHYTTKRNNIRYSYSISRKHNYNILHSILNINDFVKLIYLSSKYIPINSYIISTICTISIIED